MGARLVGRRHSILPSPWRKVTVMADSSHAHRPSDHGHVHPDATGGGGSVHHHVHAGDDRQHAPSPRNLGAVFALATLLNIAFVAAETLFGFLSHSMALLADAGHNFGDVLGLIAAWTATLLARHRPTARYTYGLRSSSILAALLNAIILLIAVGGIAVEATQRLLSPAPVAGMTMIAVAAVGVVINGASAILLHGGHHRDLNLRSAFVHMVGDVVVSLGVVASGTIILATGWLWLDPAISLVIAAVIVFATWRFLRHALDMALHAVPPGIDAAAVRRHLVAVPGVAAVHDLHIWPMSTTTTALTCHLVMPGGHPGDAVLAEIADALRDRYGIEHATIQVETGDPEHPCVLVPDHVV
jgi:cobalt-zinc-cadmium efflux system protein